MYSTAMAWILIYSFQYPRTYDGMTLMLLTAEPRARDTKDLVLNEVYCGPCSHSMKLAARVYEMAKLSHNALVEFAQSI
jgi:hypothetical protein